MPSGRTSPPVHGWQRPATAHRALRESRTVTIMSIAAPRRGSNVGTPSNGTPANPLARLTPRHLADLRASGLSDATIAACGFHSLRAPASVQEALRWKRYNGELGD